MKVVALIVVLGGLLAGAIVVLIRFGPWQGGMSAHGWAALGLGVVVSLALGGGLMALSFHSNKHGYDDAVSRDD